MQRIITTLLAAVVSSISYGQYWSEIKSGTNLKLNSVSFGTEKVGFIGGNDSTLLKSVNGGLNWSKVSFTGVNFRQSKHIIEVEFLNAVDGYMIIGQGHTGTSIYKTEDGGSTWKQEPTFTCFPSKIFVSDTSNFVVIGSGCFSGKNIEIKRNGIRLPGPQWLSQPINYLRAIDFYDSKYGIVAGDSGEIHRTFDGGDTWDTIPTWWKRTIKDLRFVSPSTIYAVIDSLSNSFIWSQDSGKSWIGHNNSLTFFYPQFDALDRGPGNRLVCAGTSVGHNTRGHLMWGRDGNDIWRYESVKQPMFDATFLSDSLAVAVGDSGTILRISKRWLSAYHPLPHDQIKVYPNPVEDQVTVDANGITFIELNVMDAMGRQVLTSARGTKTLDLGHFKPGVYFLAIKTSEGSFIQKLEKR